MDSVKRRLIQLVFEKVGRSLFKCDIIMFALHIVHIIEPQLVPEEVIITFKLMN